MFCSLFDIFAPSTKITHSPLYSTLFNISDILPLINSSWILVSSLAIQIFLSPKTSSIVFKVLSSLWGASYIINVLKSYFNSSNFFTFSDFFADKNPINSNSLVEKPEHIIAFIAAQAPGIGITLIFLSIAFFITSSPGSDIPGVPASDTNAIFFPSSIFWRVNVKDADAIISPLSTNIDKEVIDQAENLKFIANYGAGFNNIDVKYAREKGIDVTNTPKASTNATADLTIGILLAASRRIVEGDKLCRTTGFNGWAPLFFRGREVSGKTIGIVGLGEIGSAVARRAKGFDMNIIYTGPNRKPEQEEALGASYVSLDELLEQSDFITLNAAYSDDLHHLFNKETFKKMKEKAYLINASRGPIVDEKALVDALNNKEIEGAALDVYEFEPEITDELKSMDNVVLTPHIGNATFEARDMMAEIVANNTIKKLNGEEPDYIVN